MRPVPLTIEDLLMEESFIAFCKGESETNKWEVFALQSPANAELVASAKEKFIQLFNALAAADFTEQEKRLQQKLEITGSTLPPIIEIQPNRKSIYFKIAKLAVAAMFTAGIFLFYHFQKANKKEQLEYVAGFGERKNIQLPDGSSVTLNAGSKIHLPVDYGTKFRDIYLEGEAFFDVKRNTAIPFIVHTKMMDVKALGTAFNVKAYPDDKVTETVLVRGLIEVTLNKDDKRKLILHPNEKIQCSKDGPVKPENLSKKMPERPIVAAADSLIQELKPANLEPIKETAWLNNRLVFEDETFEEIAKKIERWYNVKLVFKDDAIKQYRYTGEFEKEQLKLVLDALKESNGFQFEIKDGEIKTVEIYK